MHKYNGSDWPIPWILTAEASAVERNITAEHVPRVHVASYCGECGVI